MTPELHITAPDYEPHIIDITEYGYTHRVYLVRDYTGSQWRARGNRIWSERESAEMIKYNRRTRVIHRFERRCGKIVSKIPWYRWRLKKTIRERSKAIVLEYLGSFDFDSWWTNNFHKIKNDLLSLPHVPSYSEIERPQV